jgi:ubiquitin C-terminal hydrolase
LLDCSKSITYQLTAVVIHAGLNADYGHYYSLGREGADWYILNDSDATLITSPLEQFLDKINSYKSDSAYILMYTDVSIAEVNI